MVSRIFAAAILPGFAALLISFATLGFATAPDSLEQQREVTAQQFVDRTLQAWQERLNLKDWDIKANLVAADKLEAKTLGNINWDTELKRARIAVLSPKDYRLPMREMLDDME